MKDQIKVLYEQIKEKKINPEEAIKLIKKLKMQQTDDLLAESLEEVVVSSPVEQDVLLGKATIYFKELLSSELKLPVHKIEEDSLMEKYGIDSVMIMQMTNKLEKVFGPLPKTLFFEYQTIRELTGYFLDSHRNQLKEILGLNVKEVELVQETIPVKGNPPVNPVIPVAPRRKRFASFREQAKGSRSEAMDIAIIGLAGKYPQAKDITEYWENLKDGKDCITEIPEERWDYSLYFDEDKNKPGKTNSKWGGFIDGVYDFDPLFFNISPREAELMDPQERLFLKCVYETLEDAGYTKETCSQYKGFGLEGNIGVFVGVMYEEYQLYGAQEQARGRMVSLNGNPASIANRVSYFFNFHGPSMAIDTMCSSSLTAIHLACQSLQRANCEMAIAGGVNVSVHPNKYLMLGQNNFVSSKGRCESFGEGGDGYVPGEGVGAVLLKPLSKAIADGDHIYGVVKGTAINHGGKTNGYTVPNPNAQAEVIKRAYKESGINPRAVSYIEAHGTGTSLGDPIEIAGLNKTFREYTHDKQFCKIGSAKSNIGHCESAAGIAAVTKVLLQMRHRQLVPSLHSEVLNPNIDFTDTPFIVQQRLEKWDRPLIELDGEVREYQRLAGISAFGAGGANAHVIIEEYVETTHEAQVSQLSHLSGQLFVISAKNEARLKEYALKVQQFIDELHKSKAEQIDCALFHNIAYTMQVGREAMVERLAVVASSLEEVSQKLSEYLSGAEYTQNLYRGNTKALQIKNVFEGQAREDFIKLLIKAKEFDKIAGLWVAGIEINWNLLYSAAAGADLQNPDYFPCRISMPTYPFANEVYFALNKKNSNEQSSDLKIKVQPKAVDDSFFYAPRWEHAAVLDNQIVRKPNKVSRSVVFIYHEAAADICSMVSAFYPTDQIIRIKLDSEWEKVSPYEFRIDINDPQSFDKCIKEIKSIDVVYYFGGIERKSFNTTDLAYLDYRQEQGVIGIFRLMKALVNGGYGARKITFKLVTNNVYKILQEDTCLPYAASIFGLAKSMAKEFSNWETSGIDIDLIGKEISFKSFETTLKALINENTPVSVSEVAIRDGMRFVRKLYPVNLPTVKESQFKKGGAYLIVGGAGGIGMELCLYLAGKVQGKFALVGRSELSSKVKEKMAAIESKGGKVIYLRADVTDADSMSKAVRDAKAAFGKLDGAIHSAIVLRDQALNNMEEETFKKVLAPKVRGSVVLHNALKDEKLDFVMYFSSVQSFTGNAGQSNYAAGCAFKDAFALYEREVTNHPVKLINWGFWGETGIVASEEYNQRLAAHGVNSIKTSEGMDAIERVLNYDGAQVLAIKAEKRTLANLGVDFNHNLKKYPELKPSIIEEALDLSKMPMLGKNDLQQMDEAFKKLREFSRMLLLRCFQNVGVFVRKEERHSEKELRAELKVIKKYERLFECMMDILVNGGYINCLGNGEYVSNEAVESETLKHELSALEQKKDWMCQNYLMVTPHLNLIWACLQYIWDIMQGVRLSTDIVFPNSSMKLVEKIYKDNQVSDYFNGIVTWALRSYIEKRSPDLKNGERIKILEIGAGTGGTSAMVFKGIREYQEKLEYVYTDISEAFLKHGKSAYGAQNPYVEFKLLNVEKDVLSQGFSAGDYDVIIATNVLHATLNINNTLKNTKVLMRRNGWLILNENTAVEDFITLTFGLLDGWWMYEDEANRLKGSPLLSNQLWANVLNEEGYKNVRYLGQLQMKNSGVTLVQNVVVSESDGEVKIATRDETIDTPPVPENKPSVQNNQSVSLKAQNTATIVNIVNPANVERSVEAAILDCLSQVLQIDKTELDMQTPYTEYGVDSILAGQIINEINETLGIDLNSTALFNYPTSAKLRHHVLEKYREQLSGSNTQTVTVIAKKVNPADTTRLVEDTILDCLSQVLQINKTELDVQTPYTEYGVDSILAGQIINKINETLGIDLNSTALFNYPTSATLCEHVLEKYQDQIQQSPDPQDYAEYEQYKAISEVASVNQDIHLNVPQPKSESASMDIAIVGIAGKFPGADTLQEFWDNLMHGRNSVGEIDRWDLESFYDPDPNAPNKSYIKHTGLLSGMDKFDPLFFNISPKEAELMDPHQRLFLEEAWNALEDAGFSDKYLDGKKCGVFVGCNAKDYLQLIEESGIKENNYVFTGNTAPIISARISYLLNLRGPSIIINTACSSTLVALHTACESLLCETSEIAIAGGVNVFPTPLFHTIGSGTGMFSYKDECRPFDNKADGFIPGEGVGAVVLKKLDKALLDGDHIYGVIVGSGINQDGKSNGITAPSAPSQAALEYEVYKKYQINPEHISYIEAHGTGTKLGDPIEIEALSEAFGKFTNKKQFCPIGSVKSNIGHALEASGAASLIKVLLCMKHKKLVPSINFESENDLIPFQNSPVYVNTQLKDWNPPAGTPRMAAISAFGISGTNCHVVVKEFEEKQRPEKPSFPYYLIPVSAKSENDLHNRLKGLAEWLETDGCNNNLGDIAYTTMVGRSHFSYRMAFIVRSIDGLKRQIDLALEDSPEKNCIIGGFISNNFRPEPHLLDSSHNIIKELLQSTLSELDFKEKLKFIGELYVKGYLFDWRGFYNPVIYRKLSLPNYPFANESYWLEEIPSSGAVGSKNVTRLHPLIERNTATLKEQKYTTVFHGNEFYIRDHQVGAQKVMPGAAYMEMARAGGELAAESQVKSITDILWGRPIVVSKDKEVHLGLYPSNDGQVKFEVYTNAGDQKISHAQGFLGFEEQPLSQSTDEYIDIERIKDSCTKFKSGEDCYHSYQVMGFNYGPGFQVIQELYSNADEALALLKLPKELSAGFRNFELHPSILDGALQVAIGLAEHRDVNPETTYVPFLIREIRLFKPFTTECYSHATLVENDISGKNNGFKFNITITNTKGEVLATIVDYTIREFQKPENKDEDLELLHLLESGRLKAWEVEKMMEADNG